MKKIEIIWRELLFQTLEKKNNCFTQKKLALKFNFSTSTIFQALKVPRKMGAVRVGGREFVLQDPEKLLYHWASVRDIKKDLIYQTSSDMSMLELESSMVPEVVFGAFSAYRLRFNDAPADYDHLWTYIKPSDLPHLKDRFPFQKGQANLFFLQADPFLAKYGKTTTMCQTFVDLWNLPDWYAKEYVNALKEKIDDLLS